MRVRVYEVIAQPDCRFWHVFGLAGHEGSGRCDGGREVGQLEEADECFGVVLLGVGFVRADAPGELAEQEGRRGRFPGCGAVFAAWRGRGPQRRVSLHVVVSFGWRWG